MLVTHNDKNKHTWSEWENSDAIVFGIELGRMMYGYDLVLGRFSYKKIKGKRDISRFKQFLEQLFINALKEIDKIKNLPSYNRHK